MSGIRLKGLLTLVYLFYFMGLFAQICGTIPNMPNICWEYVSADQTQIRYWIQWPDSTSTSPYMEQAADLPRGDLVELNRIDGLPEENLPSAQWKYYWEFGDGYYSKEIAGIHTFAAAGNYSIFARTTPIYSGNDEPDIERMAINIPNSLPTIDANSNFDPQDNTSFLKVEPHWHGVRPGDTVTLAISYRNIYRNTQMDMGEITLSFPWASLSLLGIRGTENPDIRHRQDIDKTEWKWDFSNLDLNEERSFFVDVKIDPNFGSGEAEAILDVDISMALPPEYDLSEILYPLGANLSSGEARGGGLPNPEFKVTNGTSEMSVNRARDPNVLIVKPIRISPGRRSTGLTYIFKFENTGLAAPKFIELHAFLDNRLNVSNMLQNGERYRYNPRIPGQLTMTANDIGTYKPKWKLSTLPGYQGVLEVGGRGQLEFNLQTSSSIDFQEGDTISSVGTIMFGEDDTLRTPPAIMRVQKPYKFRLPWYLGIKGGPNSGNAAFPNIFREGGFHIGLTARKALQPIPSNYINRRRIPFIALPSWWYQIELIATKLKVSDEQGNHYQYWMAELIPLQIRYVPGFIFKKAIAFSGGMKGSYYVDVKVNDAVQSFDFTDRLELGAFADIAILNILGRPGISFGYRVNWRFNQVINDQNSRHYQIYGHFNF